ncbi:cycloisomerase [Alienimonas chondri]|uniref:Uncharacterized protein n=1 Tax=Alienimonas chondri TaxID=2681879 RepID=A0ABX1VB89_9PLAN|nr:cycloisomerase [Alienimonas chondri]NNJ25375.1 hypothetical protein [Alienimonas chondri]
MLHVLAFALLSPPLPVGAAFEEVAVFKAPEAHQAVAVDADHFYAIGNRVIAKYDKRTGERVARIEASEELPLIHMNGGVVAGAELIVSHSNFPFTPMVGSVERFATGALPHDAPLTHLKSHSLGPTDGSLTSALPLLRDPYGVGGGKPATVYTFAHYELPLIPGYETGTSRTRVEMRPQNTDEPTAYLLPEPVLRRLRPHSVSGASFDARSRLWLSGHDVPELYRVAFPKAGSVMVLEAVHPAPIAGQGIAWDPSDPGVLWGTRRKEGLVIKMRLKETP